MSTDAFVSDDILQITPSDSTVLRAGCVICTGVAGNVAIKTLKGNTITVPITVGQTINALCTQVLSTGTTATGLYFYPAV